MRQVARVASLGVLVSAFLFAGALAPAAQASFGVTGNGSFEAGTCIVNSCTYQSIKATPSEAFTQAAGHPQWGVTTFELNHAGSGALRSPEGSPLKRLRVDVPPGLAADPEALPKCARAQFDTNPKDCPSDSKVGTTELEAAVEAVPESGITVVPPTLTGIVYNLEPSPGLPLDFGISVAPLAPLVAPVNLSLEGHVDWSGDYHEYFEINNVPSQGEVFGGLKVPLTVLKSKLNFNGRAGQGNFLTLPSVCSSTTTSRLELESSTGEISRTETHTPVGVEGCDKVPFKPTAMVSPETATSDQTDGATTVLAVPQNIGAGDINTSDIQDAQVTMPEGLTLNPAAARGLAACSAAQIGIGTTTPVACPPGSRVGTVTIETDLPPGSLSGPVYLGSPGGGTITGPPFTIYLDAEAPSLGVSVRLQGLVAPNLSTGRLEVTFTNNPQLPFSKLVLSLNGGPRAPLANPLVCGTGQLAYRLTPYTGGPAALGSTPFVTTGCPSSLLFALAQSTQSANTTAGAYSPYTFNLGRTDGQQYLSQVQTTLPAGLLGAIPSVTLCGEPQAAQGSCAAASQIGTATVMAGSGGEPYPFSGPVFLTGPYNGAPYGLSIPVAAVAGSFNLGTVVTRAAITVDPHTARVTVTTTNLPTIVGGVPVRLKNLSVTVNRPSFLFNPTNCSPLATETTLTSTFGATQGLASPFQVGGCAALAFKPSFQVSTAAKTSKADGASLQVNIAQGAHQANMRSVFVQLPKQLPSRLTTLQKACPEATFAANPVACRPLGSEVGTATVATPVLPGTLTGSAYLVSHGGASFPDLDLVLEGSGVRVILVGNTNIVKGITSSTFAAIPDVPVSSFALDLPIGSHSALTAPISLNGSLCAQTLVMPTTITAQSGAQIKQNTSVAVAGCTGGKGRARIKILSHRVVGHKLVLTVQTFAAGRVSVKGRNLHTVYRHVSKPSKVKIKVPLSRAGTNALSRNGRLKLKVRVGFLPKLKAESISVASMSVKFKG